MTRSGFVITNPTPEEHRAIFSELTKGAHNPERGRKTILDIPAADLREALAKASAEIKREREERRDIPPCYDDIDHLWHYKAAGEWAECLTSEQAWDEYDAITNGIAAE